MGRVSGMQRVVAYGHNGTATANADIWEGGTAAYPFLAAASQLEILSGSANDAAAGTVTQTTYGFCRISPTGVFYIVHEYNAGPLLPLQRVPLLGASVPEKWSLTIRCTGVTGVGAAFYSFEGILVDNGLLA